MFFSFCGYLAFFKITWVWSHVYLGIIDYVWRDGRSCKFGNVTSSRGNGWWVLHRWLYSLVCMCVFPSIYSRGVYTSDPIQNTTASTHANTHPMYLRYMSQDTLLFVPSSPRYTLRNATDIWRHAAPMHTHLLDVPLSFNCYNTISLNMHNCMRI